MCLRVSSNLKILRIGPNRRAALWDPPYRGPGNGRGILRPLAQIAPGDLLGPIPAPSPCGPPFGVQNRSCDFVLGPIPAPSPCGPPFGVQNRSCDFVLGPVPAPSPCGPPRPTV